MEETALCPYCNQPVSLYLDEGGGDRQSYVEDCSVCCRPWRVEVWRDESGELRAAIHHQDE